MSTKEQFVALGVNVSSYCEVYRRNSDASHMVWSMSVVHHKPHVVALMAHKTTLTRQLCLVKNHYNSYLDGPAIPVVV